MNNYLWALLILGAFYMYEKKQAAAPLTPTELDMITKKVYAAIDKYAAQYNVSPILMKRLFEIEAGDKDFKKHGLHKRVLNGLRSPSDVTGSRSEDEKSWGIFQLRPITAKDRDPNLFATKDFYKDFLNADDKSKFIATVTKLNDIDYSTRIACAHVRWIMNYLAANSVPATQEYIAKSYNQGAPYTVNSYKNKSKYPDLASGYYEKFINVKV